MRGEWVEEGEEIGLLDVSFALHRMIQCSLSCSSSMSPDE